MNIKSYKNLCKYCDSILFSKKSNLYTHAISNLHILKEHPVLLDNYFINYKTENKNTRSIFFKVFIYLKNFFFEESDLKISNKNKKKIEVLLLSNLIDKAHAKRKEDFYFGDIELRLKKKKIKILTVLRNFTGEKSNKIFKYLKKNRVLLTQRTTFINEIKIVFHIINQYFFIKKNFANPKIDKLKNKFLSIAALRSMANNLRIYYQIEKLIKYTRPKLVIIPFEGHAWERLIINLIKNNKIGTKVAAYQFSVTTKFQHSIFRPLKDNYNPDIIYTSGNISKKIFEQKYSCPVKILGSNKFRNKISFKSKNKIFLVVPEAFSSETYLLLNFTLELAKILPDYKFIFRCHPMMRENKILKQIEKQNNVILSKSDLNADAKNCRYVLFRGSAAVFEAVLKNSIPIYIKTKNNININPFKDIFPKSQNISKPIDILKFMKTKKNKKNEMKLINYASNYFTKLDIKSIDV